MAFRTNKVPAIEERTVSGSSVSFNSAFALPLKACKVSFEGTQEGSGTTSPTNKRPLTYKSNVSLSDNGSTNIISLGGRRFFKFDLDVLNGILEPTMEIVTIDENSDIRIGNYAYIKSDACDFYVPFEQIYPNSSAGSHPLSFARCDTLSPENVQIWGNVGYPNKYTVNFAQFHCNIANDLLGITDYTQETTTTALAKIKAWLADNPITCAIPIEETIQLTPTELSTIIGNNTFSTDTGTLEITFADLQEKSASGSVASFNTALAMPLSSCNIGVNAWQEGSGDPSPSNVRAIHGFSEVNVTANNVVHTIQLGQEVYGAEVDVVNGVATVKHEYRVYKGDPSEPWTLGTASGMSRFNLAGVSDIKRASTVLCNYLKNDMSTIPIINTIRQHPTNILAVVFFDTNLLSENTLAAWRTYLSEHNLEVVFELETPFDVQLTPTQIETIAGKTNTIYADTGDIDLTYKDLDIAKRGNFREVFKLPS